MKHTIISWDCAFRNFFHLVPALAEQDFPKDQYELIYVQQRSREHADQFNHSFGLKSLADLEAEYSERFNFRVLHIDHPFNEPYHLGKCNNAGIAQAQGEYISVMDGDMLLPPNFLTALTEFHESGDDKVVNLYRKMCQYPVGVKRFSDWMNAEVTYQSCLKASKERYNNPPEIYGNKGPLISAHRRYWKMVEGYPEAPLWATSASIAGGDTNKRLEIAIGSQSYAIPEISAVHPWHPIGYARKGRIDKKKLVEEYMSLQKKLYHNTIEKEIATSSERKDLLKEILLDPQNLEIIETVHNEERLDFEAGGVGVTGNVSSMIKAKFSVWTDSLKCKVKGFFDR